MASHLVTGQPDPGDTEGGGAHEDSEADPGETADPLVRFITEDDDSV
jgi:hypothetical protein